jgi:subtilase family serine protease
MLRRRIALLAAVTLLAAPVASAGAKNVSQTVSGPIDATNVHYRSTLVRVTPHVPDVSWQVIDLSDEIQLTNRSRFTVVVDGYEGRQPYLRIMPNGTVQLNENCQAYYLNQSFFGTGNVPSSAYETAPADWVTVAKTGQFIWHDHRIHFLSPALPAIVDSRGVDRTTLVFDWSVPIVVGSVRGSLDGKLVWIAEKPFAFPIAAIIAFVVIVIGSVAFVLYVRRRRAGDPSGPPGPPREAW